jgi:Cu/Zn superoxide dismutase
LSEGAHAYHVHVYGDCSSLGSDSAGPHLNFDGPSLKASATHGAVAVPSRPDDGKLDLDNDGMVGTKNDGKMGDGKVGDNDKTTKSDEVNRTTTAAAGTGGIAGSLGELVADKSGKAEQTVTLPASVNINEILGRAVVIHEKGNDATKPDGGAGAAVACGVIGVANPESKVLGKAQNEK